jgi:hypothetical protein
MANSDTITNYWQDEALVGNNPFAAGEELQTTQRDSGIIIAQLESAQADIQSAIQSCEDPDVLEELKANLSQVKGALDSARGGGKGASTKGMTSAGASNLANAARGASVAVSFDEAQTAAYVADKNITFQKHSSDYTKFTLAENFSWYNDLDPENQVFFQELTQQDMAVMAQIDPTFGSAMTTLNVIRGNEEMSADQEATRADNRAAMAEARAIGSPALTEALDELSTVINSRGTAFDYSLRTDLEAYQRGEISLDEFVDRVKAETQQREADFDRVNEQTFSLYTPQQLTDMQNYVGEMTGGTPTNAQLQAFLTFDSVNTALEAATDPQERAQLEQQRLQLAQTVYGTENVTPAQLAMLSERSRINTDGATDHLNEALYKINTHGIEAGYNMLSEEEKIAFNIARGQTNLTLNDAVADLREYFSEMSLEEKQEKVAEITGMLRDGNREEAIAYLESALGRELTPADRDFIMKSDPALVEGMMQTILAEDVETEQSNTTLRIYQLIQSHAIAPDATPEERQVILSEYGDRLAFSAFSIDPEKNKIQPAQFDWTQSIIKFDKNTTFGTTTIPELNAVSPANNNNLGTILEQNGFVAPASFRLEQDQSQPAPTFNSLGGLPLTMEDARKAQQEVTPIAFSGDVGRDEELGRATDGRNPTIRQHAPAMAV